MSQARVALEEMVAPVVSEPVVRAAAVVDLEVPVASSAQHQLGTGRLRGSRKCTS